MRKNTRTAFKPAKTKGRWAKTRATGGACFTVSFDRLATMLKRAGTLEADESVERFEIDNDGITVFLTGGPKPSKYRYLPFEELF